MVFTFKDDNMYMRVEVHLSYEGLQRRLSRPINVTYKYINFNGFYIKKDNFIILY